MNFLDLAVVAVTLTAMAGGYRLGFVTGLTAWIFLVQGLVVATELLPVFEKWPGRLDPALGLSVAAVAFLGVGFGAHLLGRWIGLQFRNALPSDELRQADKIGGSAVAPLAVVLGLWLLILPPLADFEGLPAQLTRNSAVAGVIDDVLPEPPDTSRALRRMAGPAGMPQVFNGLAPALNTGPPPADSGLTPAVIQRVGASTVKVEGEACGAERDGSGFAVAPDLVATNAHVVAGQDRTVVVRPDGRRLSATVAVFDSGRDLALLRVNGLGQAPLPLAAAAAGSKGAVFGHPGGQDRLRVSAVSIRQRVNAVGRDLYGEHITRRDVLILAAELRPGDSGGGLVNADGEVVGVAFAIAPDRPATAYALNSAELRPLLGADRSRTADTGPCII